MPLHRLELLPLKEPRAWGGFFEQVSKKDAKQLQRQLDRLEEHFSGLADMLRMPGCLFVVDTKREQIAVREANRLGIPVVAVCDTNADPDLVQYPIPGNDDALRSVKLITSMIAESVLAGRQRLLQEQPQSQPAEPSAQSTPPLDGANAGHEHQP
jgi:small subunit ribosomal protein S2